MKKALVSSLVILLLCVACSAQAADYYVKMSGDDNNSGESWEAAFKTVQKAFDAAKLNTDSAISVHIAAGLYKPTKDSDGDENPDDARDKLFIVPPGVSLYGGYPVEGGTSRDWQVNQTILSGDFNDDDTWDSYYINDSRALTLSQSEGSIVNTNTNQFNMPGPTGVITNGTFPVQNFIWLGNAGSFADNANYVVSASQVENTVIDGFYITGSGKVAGIAISGTSATIKNMVISGNRTDLDNGGALRSGCTLDVNNVTIIGNYSRNGGGIYNSGSPTITDSTITRNYGRSYGGGLYTGLFSSSHKVTLKNSKVSYNWSSIGGGIHQYGSDILTLSGTTILGNFAGSEGGGIYNHDSLTISNSSIVDNFSNGDGGGIVNYASAAISNSTISGNYALSGGIYGGGGIRNRVTVDITNCTITDNYADNFGGGIANTGTATLTHVTIANNTADYGGGLYNNGTLYIGASIVAENTQKTEYPNCYRVTYMNDWGYNLTNDNHDCAFDTDKNDILTMAAWTPTLADNGGLIQTILPPAEAVDVIPSSFYGTIDIDAPTTDQRNYIRPSNTLYDIGAVEELVSSSSSVVYVSPTPVNGKITSPTNLNCGTDASVCQENLTLGMSVTLTATADSGYRLSGWSGDCSEAGSASTCQLSLDSDKTVSANFTTDSGLTYYTLAVDPQPTNGTITLDGSINCGAEGTSCSATIDKNTSVILTAKAANGYQFDSWTGSCSSVTSNSCIVVMDSNKTVSANFTGGGGSGSGGSSGGESSGGGCFLSNIF